MKLSWSNEAELYLGRLYIGYVHRVVPSKWREWDCYKIGPPDDSPQHVKDNTASAKRYYEEHDSKPWRGDLMTSEDSEFVGWFASLEDAKDAMEAAAKAAVAEG